MSSFVSPLTSQIQQLLARALAFQKNEKLSEASDLYTQILQKDPDHNEALYNFGLLLYNQGDLSSAIVHYRKLVSLTPQNSEVNNILGAFLKEQRCFDEALIYFQHAIHLAPSFHHPHYNFANTLYQMGRFPEALQAYQKVIELKSDDYRAIGDIGWIHHELGNFSEAVIWLQKALQLQPEYADAYNNLAFIFKDRGEISRAVQYYRKVLQLQPANHQAHSSLLLTLHYLPNLTQKELFDEHLAWARKHAEPFTAFGLEHSNARILDRRLKIGYVSPDFQNHINVYQIEPFLARHDRTQFEIFCYSNVSSVDKVTRRLQKLSDQWRDIKYLSDQEAATLVRQDKIDILVDLAGHTSNNRLLIFARKPAPIQISYLGYVGSTGLKTVDYRFTDKFCDPPDSERPFYVEELIRLPDAFHCYFPYKESPEISSLPALASGQITFGSANILAKLNDAVIGVWSKILKALPNSRLLIKARTLNDPEVKKLLLKNFEAHQIGSERLILRGWSRDPKFHHLEFYREVDIGLDPFPFNGGQTSFDNLWMGVPVITLEGDRFVSRMGMKYLKLFGLDEWIAQTHDHYIEIAIRMANSLPQLAKLRNELRERMLQSPLMDAERFTRHLEDSYRKMWKKWCFQS